MYLPSYHRLIGLFLYMRKKKFFYIGFPTGGGLKTRPPPLCSFLSGLEKKHPVFFFRHFSTRKKMGPEIPKNRQKMFSGLPRAPQQPLWSRIFFSRVGAQLFFLNIFFEPVFFFPGKKRPGEKKTPVFFFPPKIEM